MVAQALSVEAIQGIGHLQLDGAVVGPWEKGRVHREHPALALHDRGLKVGGHGARIQRGRHDQQLQVGPVTPLEAAQQGDAQVRVQVPFVELVEHHGGDAAQLRIPLQAPQQQALGDEPEARGLRHLLLEAHRITRPLPQRLAQLVRHPRGGQARGEAARLQDPALALAQEAGFQQGWRHAGGLAGTRVRLQHQVRLPTQARGDLPQQRIDGQTQAHGCPKAAMKAEGSSTDTATRSLR